MLRVITQNILSSQLAAPHYMVKCRPEHLNSVKRMALLQQKLSKEITSNDKPCIVCLQEVHVDQALALKEFFARHDFEFVHAPYNRVLGVAVAFPKRQMELITPAEQAVVCVNDCKVGGWRESNDPAWQVAHKYRYNKFLYMEMQLLQSKQRFNIANVHLPCAFMFPGAMTVHTLVCMQYMQQRNVNAPFVIAGDFNFKPKSVQYAMITTGVLPATVSDLQDLQVNGKPSKPSGELYTGDPFKFALEQPYLKSAYAAHWGEEPPFTNYVYTASGQRTFRATLDYIFYQPNNNLQCVGAKDLSRQCARVSRCGPSLPSSEEPSDHLLMHADFKLGGAAAATGVDLADYTIKPKM